MAFTYDPTLDTDRDWVRFYLSDIDESGYYLEDATIDALLASEGSVGGACVAGAQFIIRRLSQSNFKADWLQVDHKTAREGWEKQLKELRRQFGINAVTASAGHVYRADSLASEAPTYEDGV